jgi:LuxR family maltose regulon positive regulatory protein
MIVVDEEQFRSLPASIALVRAYNAQARGDVSGTVEYTELALELIPEEDLLARAQATVSLGFTHWASGDLEAAHTALADWIESMQEAGNIVFAVASTYPLADIMIAQGRLRDAVKAYQDSLQLAPHRDEHVQRVVAHLYLGLAMLYHEMDDRKAASQHLEKARELGKQSTLPDWPYRWCLAQAQLKEARGDMEAALDLLDEAKRQTVRSILPGIRPIAALKARVYVRQGRLAKARDWVHERGLSVDDELSYLREFEHVTLARVLIARYRSDGAARSIREALDLLARLLQAAEEGKRMGSVIEVLVLQALAHQAQNDIAHAPARLERALAPLERALALAEPEGYVRIFVDEGPPMAALLTVILEAQRKGREAAEQGTTPNYVSQLRGAFGKAAVLRKSEDNRPVTQLLIEPLSKRELEVLRLLGTELNGPEIALELGVSLTTIRTHTQNIYGKLGVNNRRAAVRRAVELDLL